MLSVQKMFINYNKTLRHEKIKYIVVHDVGAVSTAKNNRDYFAGANRGSSADFFIDSNNIIQIIDYNNYYSWAVGDGGGKYGITNSNSISIEMCLEPNFKPSEKTIQNTINLINYLMNELNIKPDNVVRHYDASKKNCPQSFSANNWSKWWKFKSRLEQNTKSYISIDGGGTILDEKPAINLIIKEFSKDIERIFAYVDNDNSASWAFDLIPPNDNYVKLEKNCSKVINKRTNSNVFTEGATYKVTVKGYSKGVEVCKNTIALTVPKTDNELYRVQVGAFKNKDNAKELQENLKKYGFEGFIKE